MLATVTWYAARASGVVAYLLLAASVVFGLSLSTRIHGSRPSRPWMLDVHRMLAGLAVLLTITHVAAILLDSYTSFDVVDAFVPFASGWSPAAVAAGVVTVWLLAAVEITSLARNRLPNRVWRRIHMLSFAAFLLASAHFAAAGTDASTPTVMIGLLGIVATVVVLTGLRIAKHVGVTVSPSRGRPVSSAPRAAPVAWSSPAVAPAPAAPPAPPRRRAPEPAPSR